jgi:hypothetical protein
MNDALTVIEVAGVTARCLLHIDDYVPLDFRTNESPIGASYVRLGNCATTLLEIAVEPNDRILRGVTITSFEVVSEWPEVEVTSKSEGMPVLGSYDGQPMRIDLQVAFQVSVRDGEILVFWGELHGCHESDFQRVHCLVCDGQLRGIRFSGLSDAEVALFTTHAQGQHRAS